MHRNIITRGLGLQDEVEVDTYEIKDLLPGDTFLLSSDGFHELLNCTEMEERIRENGSDLETTCREFVDLAKDRGGHDNITVALAKVIEEETVTARLTSSPSQLTVEGQRLPRAAPWTLPLAVFGSFAAGVVLTLILVRPMATPSSTETVGPQNAGLLQVIRDLLERLPEDESPARQEALREIERLLGARGER